MSVFSHINCALGWRTADNIGAGTGNVDASQRDGGGCVLRNHNPVRGRLRRPAGHGDGDVRAVVDREDAVGVGVTAALSRYFKVSGVILCHCHIREKYQGE